MSEDEPIEVSLPPTSPHLEANDGIIHSARDFSGALTLDLTDEEIARAVRIIGEVRVKYGNKFIAKFGREGFTLDGALEALSELEDEVKTRLAEEVSILATVDTVPILEGQPPVIEIIGSLPGSNIDQYGMDHEKKTWEVQRATARGEDFYGQKS